MSSIDYYADLLDNPTRLAAFRDAIRAATAPGARVLDLGTGLGTYAFFAAEAGAGQVWGVDRDPVVATAEGLAHANGLSDRVTFLRGEVPGLELPQEVDLLIFEDFPVAFLDRSTWELLRTAMTALKPDGRVLPHSARLSLAPAGSDRLRKVFFPLLDREEDWFGLDWRGLGDLLGGLPRKVVALPDEVLGEPLRGPELLLNPLPEPGHLALEGEWEVGAEARVDGLLLWFDLAPAPGHWISNAPDGTTEPWGQWALPIREPLEVAPGQRIRARVERETVPSTGAPGWLRWELQVGEERRSGHEFQGQSLGWPDLMADT